MRSKCLLNVMPQVVDDTLPPPLLTLTRAYPPLYAFGSMGCLPGVPIVTHRTVTMLISSNH